MLYHLKMQCFERLLRAAQIMEIAFKLPIPVFCNKYNCCVCVFFYIVFIVQKNNNNPKTKPQKNPV